MLCITHVIQVGLTDNDQIGPRKWMAGQVLLFGFVATMQVFVKNRAGFLAVRLMLGLAEAGYIPGAVYTLSTWYTRRELSRRVSVLFFGMFGGNAISPILASGILKLDDARGLRGWQWLFMRMISAHCPLLSGLLTVSSRRAIHNSRIVHYPALPPRQPRHSSSSRGARPSSLHQRGRGGTETKTRERRPLR